MDISFTLTDVIDPNDADVLREGLSANALACGAPPFQKTDLAIYQKDETGRVLAGLTGKTFWNWLYIDLLWVDEPLRGQGIGAKLVLAAEEEAKRRGCHSSYLWTQNYEGPSFYPKLGYKPFVTKQDFPNGFTRTGFMKQIAA